MAKFRVHASNIHTGEYETYGPFAGPPILTYKMLRANEDEGPHYEIFSWYPQDTLGEGGDPNPHSYDSWTDQEGDLRFDGWRYMERRGHPNRITHTVPVGPFWTDLCIEDLRDVVDYD